MNDILRQRFKLSPDAFANAVRDETVLLHIKQGAYYGMNPIGTRIWAGIKEGVAPAEMCERIAGEFDVPLETVEADARTFLEDLKAHEIIVTE